MKGRRPRPRWGFATYRANRCLAWSGFKEPPIDPAVILRELGVSIAVAPLSMDALTYRTEKGYHIIVDRFCPLSRRQFSLSHELGHIVLGHIKSGLTSDKMIDAYESEANRFAAELLVPTAMLSDVARSYSVRSLPALFGVSRGMMAVRFKEIETFGFRVPLHV